MSDPLPTLRDVLTQSIVDREHEIMMYGINEKNYETSISLIDAMENIDSDMQQYRAQLTDLLAGNTRERRKVEIILAAIRIQLDEMDA